MQFLAQETVSLCLFLDIFWKHLVAFQWKMTPINFLSQVNGAVSCTRNCQPFSFRDIFWKHLVEKMTQIIVLQVNGAVSCTWNCQLMSIVYFFSRYFLETFGFLSVKKLHRLFFLQVNIKEITLNQSKRPLSHW